MARLNVELDVEIPMRDGTILRADIWRPAVKGRFPTLLQRLPYNKRSAIPSAVFPALEPVRAAAEGFVVVVQDTRGAFASEGRFKPFAQERLDGADTIAWIARQSFSDGQVGMYGVSYGGLAQLLAAAEAPPALRAIAPQMTGAEPYSWFWEGGALRLGFALWWAASAFARSEAIRRNAVGDPVGRRAELDAVLRDPWSAFEVLPITEHPVLDELFPAYNEWINHPTRDAYWSVYPTPEDWGQAYPALHVGGWYDLFLRDTLRAFAATSGNLIIGPWAHALPYDTVGEVEFGPEAAQAAIDLAGRQIEWFRNRLMGEPTEAPTVQLFVMGANRWRNESAWPPERVRPTTFYLRAGNGLSLEPPATAEASAGFMYDPSDPVPTIGGATFLPGLYVARHGGPRDQSSIASRRDILTYASPPLERDVEVTGDITVHLYAATSGRDTDWTAKVMVVDRHGVARNLADGIIRARYRGGDCPQLLDPGEPHEVKIDVGATCVLLRRGERIAVQISSSNFPKYDRNANNGGDPTSATQADFVVASQTIFHDASRPSRLIMPIAG